MKSHRGWGGSDLRERRPLLLGAGGLDAGFDEGHAVEPVVDIGEIVGGFRLAPGNLVGDGIGRGEVDICKSFDKAFGVAGGKTAIGLSEL